MSKLLHMALICLMILIVASPLVAGEVTAQQVFDQLKSFDGTWEGEAEGAGEGAEGDDEAFGLITHDIQVSAAGTVVMETMAPGTEHEMINMYHLDGDDLVLTHYCAGGNQPQMRLDLDESSADLLVFDFVSATNLDPATDHYIGSARIQIIDDDHIESIWGGYKGSEQLSTMTFHLARTD